MSTRPGGLRRVVVVVTAAAVLGGIPSAEAGGPIDPPEAPGTTTTTTPSQTTTTSVAPGATTTVAPPATAAPPAEEEPEEDRPNILLLYTDDQTVAQMEALPATSAFFASEGLSFGNAMVSYPLCCPSRATLLTGRYTHNTGVPTNFARTGGGFRTYENRNGASSLPVALDAAGYHTGWLGKYLNEYGDLRYENPETEHPAGWDDWRPAVGSWSMDYWNTRINDNGTVVDLAGTYQTDAYAQLALDMIDQAVAQPDPFFLGVSFYAPHIGHVVRPDLSSATLPVVEVASRHEDLYVDERAPRHRAFNEANTSDKPGFLQRRYGKMSSEAIAKIDRRWRSELRSLRAVDEAVTAIRARLDEAGVIDDTVIVFTSDNGYMHGEHRVRGKKFVPYRESIDVPLYFAGPGIRRGVTDPQLVSNIDLTPTFLDYADAAPLAQMDGRSLRRRLERGVRLGGRRGRPLLIMGVDTEPQYPASYVGVRWGKWAMWKWYRSNGKRPVELYDLRNDPHQLRNLAGRPEWRKVQRGLAEMQQRLRRCAGRSCHVNARQSPAALA